MSEGMTANVVKRGDRIHRQLHNSVAKLLTGPAHVRVIGYLRPRNLDSAAIQLDFADLVSRCGLDRQRIDWIPDGGLLISELRGNPLFIRLMITPGQYAYEAWLLGNRDDSFDFGVIEDLEALEDGLIRTSRLTDLDIVALDRPATPEEAVDLLHGSDVLGSTIREQVNVATNLEPDSAGRERYLIYSNGSSVDPRLVESTINGVIAIENSFHLLSEPQERYAAAGERLSALESRTAVQLSRLTGEFDAASTEQLKEWLRETTGSFAELAALLENVREYFTEAMASKDRLRSTLRTLNPKPLNGFELLAEPLLRAANTITSDYGTLVNRIESVRRQRADAISLLRTKIDLLQRDQSFALQCSMHKTTRAQMAMQQSIEGLYVFIVGFYLTELARLVFEALHSRHIITYSPTILTAIFIPVALFAGLVLSGKAGRYRRRWASGGK